MYYKVIVDFKVNYSHQTNKVYSLVNGVNELGLGNYNYVIVGQSAYKFKLTDYIRDDQGHVIVDKQTGMPTINPNLTTFGNTLPKDILGLNMNPLNQREIVEHCRMKKVPIYQAIKIPQKFNLTCIAL